MTATPTQDVVYQEIDFGASGRTTFRYTLDRYNAAIEAGILTEEDSVELIFGYLIEAMPIGQRHEDCIDDLIDLFNPLYRKTHRCRAQNSINLLNNSAPEPDFALVSRQRYSAHPGKPLADDVDLLIEVSDSTLNFDRTTKARLYALAGIKEYWIVNLQQDRVEVYLEPDVAAGVHSDVRRYALGDTFKSPFCGEMQVSKLIPG
ncbi:Uma2 family endonuclease [Neolewinella antarctica]|uniref:Uma2 family endonuclease n=1 Tax=Neolewinella antarctica TaxID=442734 RepID=A0ABX0X6P8_9BACT|nr:Uma2 family endonuclease [Neolewinella antarctica]NJC24542.1 Uma2 family endonuclease [Neolewinella antarctica]